jgi:hypothetical protein
MLGFIGKKIVKAAKNKAKATVSGWFGGSNKATSAKKASGSKKRTGGKRKPMAAASTSAYGGTGTLWLPPVPAKAKKGTSATKSAAKTAGAKQPSRSRKKKAPTVAAAGGFWHMGG